MAHETTSRGGGRPRGDSPPARGQGFAVLDDESGERFATSKEFASYALHDPVGREVGKIEQIFVNDDGGPEYVEVKIGTLWRKRTVLIPVESVYLDGGQQAIVLR